MNFIIFPEDPETARLAMRERAYLLGVVLSALALLAIITIAYFSN